MEWKNLMQDNLATNLFLEDYNYCINSVRTVVPWLTPKWPKTGYNTGFESGQQYECIKLFEHHKCQKSIADSCVCLGTMFFEYGLQNKNCYF